MSKSKNLITEFKAFVMRGNVIDMAVGVVMGTAFGKIVSSVVSDIFMPMIGVVLGGVNFSGLHFKIGKSVIAYGAFIQNVIDFIIIALCMFLFITLISAFSRKKKEEEKTEQPKKSEETVLLEEIRDLLKEKN